MNEPIFTAREISRCVYANWSEILSEVMTDTRYGDLQVFIKPKEGAPIELTLAHPEWTNMTECELLRAVGQHLRPVLLRNWIAPFWLVRAMRDCP